MLKIEYATQYGVKTAILDTPTRVMDDYHYNRISQKVPHHAIRIVGKALLVCQFVWMGVLRKANKSKVGARPLIPEQYGNGVVIFHPGYHRNSMFRVKH